MSDREAVSLAGRWAYFWALAKYWPEALSSLRHDVLPVYQPNWHTEDALAPMPIMESWSRLQSDIERKELLAAIQQWAVRFRITEEWILDAALETLLIYCPSVRSEGRQRNETWCWRYSSKGFHPRFEPTFDKNYWYASHAGQPERWEDFKGRMESELSAQLMQYRRTVELRFGVGREETLNRDAGWTARYQKGDTAIEIAETEILTNSTDPEQMIFQAIRRFARIIGLKLRRRGERIRRNTLQHGR